MTLSLTRMRYLEIGFLISLLGVAVSACSDRKSEERFSDALRRGELTEAERYLEKISDDAQGRFALQLIRTYLDLGEPSKAIHIYEDITPWHASRTALAWSPEGYSARACRLLREYLIAEGDYDRAWSYYPLEYIDEAYIGNARSLYAYMSDVVLSLCARGEVEEAYRFVQSRLPWFVTYVDTYTGDSFDDIRQGFRSEMVRDRLHRLIEDSY